MTVDIRYDEALLTRIADAFALRQELAGAQKEYRSSSRMPSSSPARPRVNTSCTRR